MASLLLSSGHSTTALCLPLLDAGSKYYPNLPKTKTGQGQMIGSKKNQPPVWSKAAHLCKSWVMHKYTPWGWEAWCLKTFHSYSGFTDIKCVWKIVWLIIAHQNNENLILLSYLSSNSREEATVMLLIIVLLPQQVTVSVILWFLLASAKKTWGHLIN